VNLDLVAIVTIVTSILSVAIALAALGLGIFNYRQARRRDRYQLRAAVTQSMLHPQFGPAQAHDLNIELTNVGQRPVTIKDVAMVWSQRGLRGRITRYGRHFRWRRSYHWHGRLKLDGIRLGENHPQKVVWAWGGAAAHLQQAKLGPRPVLVGVQVRMGVTDTKLLRVRNPARIEETARAILAGELPVYRPGQN